MLHVIITNDDRSLLGECFHGIHSLENTKAGRGNALTDVKRIRLGQQNATLSLFGGRASSKEGKQSLFTNHYQIWVPSLLNANHARG